MISKELLSAVLTKEVKWIDLNMLGEVVAHFDTERYLSDCKSFNIHELGNLVKEWAYTKSYMIHVFKPIINNKEKQWFSYAVSGNNQSEHLICSDEPESVFRAGAWILKEISK